MRHSGQRGAGRGRAHDERHRRRPVRHLLGREDRQAIRTQRQRLGAQGLTIDHLEAKGMHSMPQSGIDSVTVPGAVDGWTKLHDRFGKLPGVSCFSLRSSYAEHGYRCARNDPRLLGRRRAEPDAIPREPARVSAGWQSARHRPGLSQSRSGPRAHA